MNILICYCDVFKIVIKMFLMGIFKNCIQNLFSLFFYNQIRIFKKGIRILFIYRCVRGFIFLEFFYLYLNRFIFSEIIVCGLILILLIGIDFELYVIGISVNDVYYQVFFLEGFYRWNQDRVFQVVEVEVLLFYIYSGFL